MPPKGHAILSASSSDRWLHCPPSARLCETYEDKGSDYAAEGTDAHSLCEYKLRKALGMKATDPTKNLDWYNAEMDDCATGYVCFYLIPVFNVLEKNNIWVTLSHPKYTKPQWTGCCPHNDQSYHCHLSYDPDRYLAHTHRFKVIYT